MDSVEQLREVIRELKDVAGATSEDPTIADADLRRVLSFLAKVAQIVDQAFEDVYSLAIELTYLTDADLASGRVLTLRRDLDLVLARSHYRDAEEICSRLKHLREQFESQVRPLIEHLPGQDNWRGLFWLIEEREGRIIMLIQQTTMRLGQDLASLNGNNLLPFRDSARTLIQEMRPLLVELRDLTSKIMGFSGKPGLLELTSDRAHLRRSSRILINQGEIRMSNDTYNAEQAGAMGPGAHASNMTFVKSSAPLPTDFDLKALSAQLAQLRAEMRKDAKEPEEDEAVAAIGKAERAAVSGDQLGALQNLKSAGRWALDVATKLGVSVASKAIEHSLGMP